MEAPRITIARARTLRRKLTLPEVLLWKALRGDKLGGFRFRRQHPMGRYILDFYCVERRLAVEVDGEGHARPDQHQHDQRRTAWLTAQGVTVMRIASRDVLGNLDGVLGSIRLRAMSCPLHRPSDGPPPPAGEDC